MAELCLVASHGYPPGLFFHPAAERGIGRASKVIKYLFDLVLEVLMRLCLVIYWNWNWLYI